MNAVPTLLKLAHESVIRALSSLVGTYPFISAVDCTCGNGQDTLFMARLLSELARERAFVWKILAFDVQEAALQNAAESLATASLLDNVELILEGHEKLGEKMTEHSVGNLAAAMYNLGFLPRSDKVIITRPDTTLVSLKAAADALIPGGVLSVHSYGGHPGGLEELEAVENWFHRLDDKSYFCTRHEVCNKKRNHEVLFLAERRKY